MASVQDLMVTDMVTARPREMVADVARRMIANRVGAVMVVEDGVLLGLFSERDLLTRVVGEHRDPQQTPVSSVATTEVVTIERSAPFKAGLEVFRQRKFRHLPVTDGGKPVGILSTRDFLEYLVGGLERYIDDLKYRHDLEEGVDPYDHIGGAYGR